MAITLTIDRTELALGTLQVVAATGYEVTAIEEVEVGERQDWAKSPYIAGGSLVSSVMDIVGQTIAVEVQGTSRSDVQTKAAALIAAYRQLTYTIDYALDGTSYKWQCYRASSIRAPLGAPDFYLTGGNFLTVTAIIPRQPIALSGPI